MLTRNDIQILKKAADIVFRVHEGIGTIEAITQRETTVYKEQIIIIPVGVYGTITEAFVYKVCTGSDLLYQTFAGLLKEGDKIDLVFRKDSKNNELLKNANLHHDSLEIKIKRDKKELYFLMETQVTLDNSSRMIKG